jgi:hypothetical protein
MKAQQDQVYQKYASLEDHMHTKYKPQWPWSREPKRQAKQDQLPYTENTSTQ